jgi:hypothetical protein
MGSDEHVIWLIDHKTWSRNIRTTFSACAFGMNSLAKQLVFYLLVHRETTGAKRFISALVETFGDSLAAAQLETQRLFSDHLPGRVRDARIVAAMELIEVHLPSL